MSKNAEFHADFESIEKGVNAPNAPNAPKKSYKQNKFDKHV